MNAQKAIEYVNGNIEHRNKFNKECYAEELKFNDELTEALSIVLELAKTLHKTTEFVETEVFDDDNNDILVYFPVITDENFRYQQEELPKIGIEVEE